MKVFGRAILELLKAKGVEINTDFDFFKMEDSKRDLAVREFVNLSIDDEELFNEGLVGHSEFGPFNKHFLAGPLCYCVALSNRLREAVVFSDSEKAELLQCQALDNSQCRKSKGINIFQLFNQSRDDFYDLVAYSFNEYAQHRLINQIEEALPAFLYDQNENSKLIAELDHAEMLALVANIGEYAA